MERRPLHGSTSDPVAADCTTSTCDDFLLMVTGTDPSIHNITVHIDWGSTLSDLDLHVYNNATGAEIITSGQPVGNSEQATFTGAPGVYRISVLVYAGGQRVLHSCRDSDSLAGPRSVPTATAV